MNHSSRWHACAYFGVLLLSALCLAPAPRATDSKTSPSKPDYWSLEDPKAREKLPLYKVIPAARPEELTPTNSWPDAGEYANWYRSQANDACSRYSPLD